MDCRDFEKMIPLYVGGDLEPSRAQNLRRHLETCAECRRLADELEASRAWLQGLAAPQFEESILDDLRAAVQREIARTQPRSLWRDLFAPLRERPSAAISIAVSAALLLLLAGVVSYRDRSRSIVPQIAEVKPVQDRTRPEPGKPDQVAGTGSAETAPALRPVKSVRPGRKPGRPSRTGVFARWKAPERPAGRGETPRIASLQPADAGAAAIDPRTDREMTRIEIQTADPNIRIIWLAPLDSGPPSKSNGKQPESNPLEENGDRR
jgi:hypothetical protein